MYSKECCYSLNPKCLLRFKEETRMNQVTLEEELVAIMRFLKSPYEVAEKISVAMHGICGENDHTEVSIDEEGKYVYTMDSEAEAKVQKILKSYLNKGEVNECFKLLLEALAEEARGRTENYMSLPYFF